MMFVVSRSAWGARPPRSVSLMETPAPEVWLHHTAGNEPDGPEGVRQIQNFHMDVRGWHDIAYSWVVDRAGTVYEGRGKGIVGGHTKGRNSVSHAICVMGDYTNVEPPKAVLASVAALLRAGVAEGCWTRPELSGGHRDVGATSCPGDRLYAHIGTINRLAKERWMPSKLIYAAHRTPEAGSATAVLNAATGGQARGWAITTDPAEAREAKASGVTVLEVGGTDDVPGATKIRGVDGLSTLIKLAEALS